MLIVVYNCLECSHTKHNKSRHHQPKVDGKRPVYAATDGSDQNIRSDSNSGSIRFPKNVERSVLELN